MGIDSLGTAWYTMERRIVYRDDVIRRTSIVDDADPTKLHVETTLDLESTLESIKRDRELQSARSTNKLLARVPMTVYEKSLIEQWDEADWKKWLNDPDNAAFRVWSGQV